MSIETSKRLPGDYCKDCASFAEADQGINECRRFAPKDADPVTKRGWPQIYADDWCEAFRPQSMAAWRSKHNLS